LFGYFPTYALGNVIAGQLHVAAESALGALDDAVASGRASSLLEWLRANVHALGQTLDAEDLVREVTGHALATDGLLDALDRKYERLYRLR
jgi:carboxypeptidase Taq